MQDELFQASSAYLRRAGLRHALRRGLRVGALVGLAGFLISVPMMLLGIGPSWLWLISVTIITLGAAVVIGRAALRKVADESSKLWLLKRLDSAVGAEDGLLTALSLGRFGQQSGGTQPAFLGMISSAVGHKLSEEAVKAVVPAFPARSLSLTVALLLLSALAAVVAPSYLSEGAGVEGRRPGAEAAVPATEPRQERDPQDKPRTSRRVTRPPGGSVGQDGEGRRSSDEDPASPGASGTGAESSGTAESESKPEGEVAGQGTDSQDGSRAVRPRTSEPSFLKPAAPPEAGFTPALAGPQSGSPLGTPPAQMPWERPTGVPGLPPREAQPVTNSPDDPLDRPTGERRRPPVRPTSPTEPPEPARPYVEQPMKILPEVSDGDRKAVEARRLVYSPDGTPIDEQEAIKVADGSGMPPKATAPQRSANVRGGTSDAERVWLETWIARFSAK